MILPNQLDYFAVRYYNKLMLAIIFSPVYLAGCFILFRDILRWLQACTKIAEHKVFRTCFIIMGVLISGTPFFGAFWRHSTLQRDVQIFSDFWLGVFMYFFMALVVLIVVRFIMEKTRTLHIDTKNNRKHILIAGSLIIIAVITVCVYGFVHSKDTITTTYSANVDKACSGVKTMKIVEIADLHLGYDAGEKEMQKVVKLVNAQHPDLICVAGDIFNNNYSAIKDPDKVAKTLAGMKSRYGTYACWGNHDVAEPIMFGFTFSSKRDPAEHTKDMYSFLKKADIKILEDETTLVDDKFYIAGRLDAHKPGGDITARKTARQLLAGLDKSKPIILLDHEPKDLQGAADAGADLDISGHTHDGQFFPLNMTQGMMWENPCGVLKKDSMTSVVTSGTGVFGPCIRVGTNSEIVSLNVTFK